MFAPTKALDEEDAEHYNDVVDRKKNDFVLAKMQEVMTPPYLCILSICVLLFVCSLIGC